jgi:hypothetical protein
MPPTLEQEMSKTYATSKEDTEQKIRNLESELYVARRVIIHLMPERGRKILMSYYDCESLQETYGWKDKIAEQLVEMAEPIGPPYAERAYCPLCGEGSSSGRDQGYSIPLGLTRHLTGWGRSYECKVVAAASALARSHWEDKFSENPRWPRLNL